MFEIILSQLAIVLSLCTSTGILLHETKMDKIASLALFSSATTSHTIAEESTGKLEGTAHTHVERASLERASSELRGQTPRINPQRYDKKYRLQRKVSRGVYAFDSYHLPLGLADNGQLSL